MKLKIIDGVPIWPRSLDKELAQLRAGVWRIAELEQYYGLKGTIGHGRTHKIYRLEDVDAAVDFAHGISPNKNIFIQKSQPFLSSHVKLKGIKDHLD